MRRSTRQLPGRTRASLRGVVLSLLAVACSKKAPPPPPPSPVTVVVAQSEVVPVQILAIGAVESSSSVPVQARVAGAITEVRFGDGQEVEAGDVLFTLDRRPFEIALAQAEGALARDRVQAANAAVEAQRWAGLAAEGIASREDAEQRRTAAEAFSSTIQIDEAAVAAARLNLSYATVRAPIAGRAGAILNREGVVVRADDTVLVVINQLHPVFVGFPVPEENLPEIQRFMATGALPVSAAAPGESGPPEAGTVTFVDNAVDRATGTVRLRGTFANPGARLWPGQFVRVAMTLSTRPFVVVPSAAVQSGQSGLYVFIVSPEGTALMRPVVVARIALGDRSAIERGVSPGDQVVIDGQIRLVPGAKVAIVNAAPDAGAPGEP